LSLCARFVGDDFEVEECFHKSVPVTELSGEDTASTIWKKLSKVGIDISKMCGRGFDEAAAMSGKLKGVPAHEW